ncbi:hypothetical protein FG475_23345 [Vibrio navarrensis]|nr:hypothetical protein [Vibrio navarrensis]
MKINWLWSFLSSFGISFRFLGKSALFVNASFAFALNLPKMIYQNFQVFKSHERPQILSYFGF